jgi:hypothetical protein
VKRRKFLIASSSTVASLAMLQARAAQPCPPPTVSVSGGNQLNTPCTPPAPGTAPAWFTALGDLERGAPLTNWLGDSAVRDPLATGANAGSTGHKSIFTTWNGALVDPVNRMVALLGNGGHNDYYGNEVYAVRLTDDSPGWRRLRNATSAGGSGSLRIWSDGRPTASHTYSAQVAANGRWFLCGLHGGNYLGGSSTRSLFEFMHPTYGLDNSNNDWVDRGDILTLNFNTGNCIAFYDAAQDRVLYCSGGNFIPSIQYIRPSDRAITSTNVNALNDGAQFGGGFDTTHRCVLLRGNNGWWTMRMSAPGAAWRNVTSSGVGIDTQHGFAWHSASNAFLTYVDGAGLVKGRPTLNSSGDITSIAWSSVSGISGVSPPSITANGLHNRVGILPNMGDGRDCFVWLPAYGNKDLYVIPLPAGGVA